MYAPKHHSCHNQSITQPLLGNWVALSDYRLCRALHHHSPLSQSWNHAGSCLRCLGWLSVFVPCSSSLLITDPALILVICGIHCLLLLHLKVVYGRYAFWHALQLIVSSHLLACTDGVPPFLPFSLALFDPFLLCLCSFFLFSFFLL